MSSGVLVAAFWGGLAALTLLIGAGIAIRLSPSDRTTGAVMGLGAGALIGSIAYELVPESTLGEAGLTALLAFAAGALTFFVGDWVIDSRGGEHRKRIRSGPAAEQSGGARRAGVGAAIFLGTLLDGIPESLVLGTSLALGSPDAPGVSVAFLVAVVISNLPEGIAGTRCLVAEGHPQRRVLLMWVGLVAASAAAAAAGYAFATLAPGADGRLVQSFAAGAMLTMLADTMMPEAFKHGGKIVGLLTTLGFLLAGLLAVLE